MQDITTRLVPILRRYMPDPGVSVDARTVLHDIGIDALDLPVIGLDIEDAYGARVAMEDDLETLGDLAARVAASLAARSAPRPRRARPKSSWMSNTVEQRRFA